MTQEKGRLSAQARRDSARTGRRTLAAALLLAGLPAAVFAHTGILPPSLKDVKLAPVPGLLDGSKPIVVDKAKAIALGKALFWDMNVGSDGMACGTCHFHAGADSRTKNQFSPAKTHLPASFGAPNAFDPKDPRGTNLSNWQLTKRDFPIYQFDSSNRLIEESFTYNAVASSGTFSGEFVGVKNTTTAPTGSAKDECKPYAANGAGLDQTYHVGNLHTRRVEPRNTPTMVNAVLFDRLFWDGRANHYFNGATSFGPRDPDAFVWIADGGAVWKSRMALQNASFASLAVGPPLNEFEMSCKGRTHADLGRKLLKRRALETQAVHPEDSVLGVLRDAGGKGLGVTYEQLIKDAFDQRFWSAGKHALFGKPAYDKKNGFTQAEANFALFFGLAVQMYSETLIADDTPYDRANVFEKGYGTGGFEDRNGVLTQQQMDGFRIFNDSHCISCHTGPAFSTATNRVSRFKDGDLIYRTMVNRILTGDGKLRMVDTGFLNNGAVPSAADPGIDTVDDYGGPLAFSVHYLAQLAGRKASVLEPLPLIQACKISFPAGADKSSNSFTSSFTAGDLLADPAGTVSCASTSNAFVHKPDIVAAALDRGASEQQLAPPGHQFKVPQLYNVELTGPYMHNGGMSTLEQVLDHYMGREGNFNAKAAHPNADIHKGVLLIFDNSAKARSDLIAFLGALTDERVRYEKAPFDHPEVRVPNGHPGNEQQVQGAANDPGLAKDDILTVPAVGRNGRVEPLAPFYELLPD